MRFIKDDEHKIEIEKLLTTSKKIVICSGWLYNDGLKLLSKALQTAIKNNAYITIYSSIEHSQKKEIEKLNKNNNFIHKLLKKKNGKIHTKLYYFENGNEFTAIVGSANITRGGLKMNKELSILIEDLVGSKNYVEIQNYIKSLDELS